MTEYSQNKNKNLLVSEVIERMDPPYRDVYKDSSEIQNYAQDGSFFYKASKPEILMKIVEHALSKGLEPSEKLEFLKGSAIWEDLNKTQQKDMLAAFMSDCYFPGPIHITKTLTEKFHLKTIAEIDSDREKIYFFNGQIYERAEEKIKAESHMEYLKQWEKMLTSAEANEDKSLAATLREKLNRGPSVNDINEVLAMIRRTTYTYEEMNPSSYIPFLNGLLNLKTRKMEAFSPDLFYTYQVNANLLGKHVSLNDTPQFAYLLNTAFYETDISLILSYFAYAFYPDLPVHKILLILGRERIGKGTSVRVLQGLMPKGSGSISLARLLTSERFQFTGIEAKNLLVDSETKRKFRRGTVLEWSAFCNLFGKDILSIEPKGREARDYISKAKGIFLGNLPFIPVDSPPAIARILLVVTRDDRPKRIIPDLDQKILGSEKDEIATLLIQILFKLVDRNFLFPGQLRDDSTAQLIEQLADPVENFIDEESEYDKDCSVQVDDAYSRFLEWCKGKGIPPIARQTFVKKFGRTYPKKRIGAHGNGGYAFTGCLLYKSEVKVTEGDQKQVGTQSKLAETQKISLSREHYRRFQHEYTNLHVTRAEKNHVTYIEYTAQKLEPNGSYSKNREIKGPEENESGSTLYRKSDPIDGESKSKIQANPSNSAIQNEKPTFNMDEVKNYIIEIVRDEAPKSQFHSFSKHELVRFVRERYIGIPVGSVYDLIQELHDKGFIYKPKGKNFVYNAEGG